MTNYHYRCPHGHIVRATMSGFAQKTLKYGKPEDIAYCAFCEHKQTELIPVTKNRAQTYEYCETKRIEEEVQ